MHAARRPRGHYGHAAAVHAAPQPAAHPPQLVCSVKRGFAERRLPRTPSGGRGVWASATFPKAESPASGEVAGSVTVRYITGATTTIQYLDTDPVQTVVHKALQKFIVGPYVPARRAVADTPLDRMFSETSPPPVARVTSASRAACVVSRRPRQRPRPTPTPPSHCHSCSPAMIAEHRLLYAGQLLDQSATVAALGLDAESCLHLVRKPAASGQVRTAATSPKAAGRFADSGCSPAGPTAGSTVAGGACTPKHEFESSDGLRSPGYASTTSVTASLRSGSGSGGGGGGAGAPAGSTDPRLPGFGPAPVAGSPGPREMRPTDVDTTLIRFKQTGLPPEVRFYNDGLTAETNGKWVTVMADMEGVSCGRLEWELFVSLAPHRTSGRSCFFLPALPPPPHHPPAHRPPHLLAPSDRRGCGRGAARRSPPGRWPCGWRRRLGVVLPVHAKPGRR